MEFTDSSYKQAVSRTRYAPDRGAICRTVSHLPFYSCNSVLICLVALTFDLLTLKLVRIIAHGVGSLRTNFGASLTFTFSTYWPTPHDIATLTFDLGDHGACRWYGSSCSNYVPSLQFVGLPIRKTCHTFGSLSNSRPDDLDLWALILKLMRIIAHGVGKFPTNFGVSENVSFSTYEPIHVIHITWPCDLHLWPWRSWRLSMIRSSCVLHLFSDFEVRMPSHSENYGTLSVKTLIGLVILTFDL